jgi:hypothetical protein
MSDILTLERNVILMLTSKSFEMKKGWNRDFLKGSSINDVTVGKRNGSQGGINYAKSKNIQL